MSGPTPEPPDVAVPDVLLDMDAVVRRLERRYYTTSGVPEWDLAPEDVRVLLDALEAARAALAKINDIRNSIVGLQTVNWSEHIYPLVAALNEAGQRGMDYPEAREFVGTLLDRTNAAEQRADRAEAALAVVRAALAEAGIVLEALWLAEHDGTALAPATKAGITDAINKVRAAPAGPPP